MSGRDHMSRLTPGQGSPSDESGSEPLELQVSRSSGRSERHEGANPRSRLSARGLARHTIGVILVLAVVILWTTSNFLGSSIFADNTYAKPFFMNYLNTAFYIFAVVPFSVRTGWQRYRSHSFRSSTNCHKYARRPSSSSDESRAFLKPDEDETRNSISAPPTTDLSLVPTARLALVFCFLWFAANYFAMSCLQYTTVASTTILTASSSIWTLLFGTFTSTERFTVRKFIGVITSITGVFLVSRVDLTSSPPPPTTPLAIRPSPSSSALSSGGTIAHPFPTKPAAELFLGDTLALLSAMIYGIYTIILKKTTLNAHPRTLNLQLFFGLVGAWNTFLLWPLFFVLHFTGVESFALPPNRRVWNILLLNSVVSFLSDLCWAYAMLLTSPLIATLGLSLTIPLSLVGEWIVQDRTEGLMYWLGAGIVVGSFVFVEREGVKEKAEETVEVLEDGRWESDGAGVAVGEEEILIERGAEGELHRPKRARAEVEGGAA